MWSKVISDSGVHVQTALIIGCGRVARHHARAISSTAGIRLEAVCDLDPAKGEGFSREFGVPYFENYHKMLKAFPDAGVVAVITPSGMHLEHSLDVIKSYHRNVILEKPPTLKPSDLATIFEAAESQRVSVFPVFQNRHNKAVQRVLRALHDGQLGKIRLCSIRVHWNRPQRYYDLAAWRGTWALDGGCLTNQGIHHLDIMRFLAGDVSSVTARTATQRAVIEVEDTAVALVTFSSGALGTVEVTTAAEPTDLEASISLVCENGMAKIGGVAANELEVFTPDEGECVGHSEDFSESIYGSGHSRVYEEVVAALTSKEPFSVTPSDAMGSLNFLNSLYLADEESRWVSVNNSPESARTGKADEHLASLYRSQPQP